jgi:hypothetical protein
VLQAVQDERSLDDDGPIRRRFSRPVMEHDDRPTVRWRAPAANRSGVVVASSSGVTSPNTMVMPRLWPPAHPRRLVAVAAERMPGTPSSWASTCCIRSRPDLLRRASRDGRRDTSCSKRAARHR